MLKLTALIWLIPALALTPLAAQEIYRVVDQHGNVTYTDEKPSEDAEPMALPELNVMGDEQEAEVIIEQQAGPKVEPLGFRIDSPGNGAIVSAGPNGLPVRLEIDIEVPATAQIVIFLDDIAQSPVNSLEPTLEQIPPGIYRMRAELQTPSGRVLAGTETISFEVRPAGEPLTDP